MAFSRFGKGTLIFVAAAMCLRDEKEMRAASAGRPPAWWRRPGSA
ncbi:hypothetical protein [Prosthecobacter sp.]